MPANENVIPKRFTAYIGGYTGHSYRVRFDGYVFTYSASERCLKDWVTEELEVTEADWAEFRAALDCVDAWGWKKSYFSEECDGTGWDLHLKYEDRAIKCHGRNSAPEENGEEKFPETSKLFGRYLAAVSQLAGGRRFA